MRTLSATLTSAQENISASPIWKVVLSRTGQTTRGYDINRIIKSARTEEPNSHKADITLLNIDGALTSLDFEHYQAVISKGYDTGAARTAWVAATVYAIDDIVRPVTANGYQYRCSIAGTSHATTEPTWGTALGVTQTDNTVTWEMDGNSGDEYSRAAPLRVRVQELHSGVGLSKVILHCYGLQDQLKEDTAKATHTQLATNADTVKTLITAICNASTNLSSAYNGYAVITVVYDSEDSLIDTFKPADYFSISLNANRWDKITELLDYTGCKARFENDGKLHISDPTISGVSYNYEYKFNVAGDHLFWNKSIRLRFVKPNEEVVKTSSDITPAYTGSATSATSYALDPKTHTTEGRFVSVAQCNAIAAAKIERYELDDEKGIVIVPPNVGQELWDYVKVTDSRTNDTNTGNIQFIRDDVETFPGTNRRPTWIMTLSFGKVTAQSLMAAAVGASVAKGLTDIAGVVRGLTDVDIFTLFNEMYTNIKSLTDVINSVIAYLSGMNSFATISEIDAGNLLTKGITPFAIAGSIFGKKVIGIIAVDATTDLTVADGKAYVPIPASLNGMNLTRAQAIVITAGTTNATTIDIYNVTDSQDMLSTAISIASGATVGTVGVINATYDDVATNDVLRVDVTTMSTTAPKGLLVVLEFRLP